MTPHEHATRFGTIDGELRLGGQPLSRVAARVGQTPFFAYDRSLLDARVDELRGLLPARVELSYAMKANPMPALVQHLARRVDRIDVASAGEMQHALDTGIRADRVSFAGPGKTPAEIRQAVAAGIIVEVESATELARVTAAAGQLGVRALAAVRVNPDFAVKGSGMRMGGGPQQFGIDAEQVPDVLARAGDAVDILGFHVFAGSQNLQADIIAEAQRRTVDLVTDLAEHLPGPLRYLNLGGGFGIPYTARDQPLDLRAVAEGLAELVDGPIAARFPEASPVIELGRFLVGECGVYVTRVVDRKVSRGKTFVVVDGGMHHQLAASGNFGQAIRRNYPVVVGNRATDAKDDDVVTVVGCLCTPLDLLADDVPLPDADIDDLIVVFQQGAYGLTASPTAFLGHPAPAEVLV
ncbi:MULTISPECIES: pyridoxal-dependent decarboxylase, exosortase A system-associated [Microbacterium]|jgi:diaminopimelate decarboxylase|uniref:pyridoxal-dependent decarboxylase, exosortase A system-associated n=1 Tax=Microbacterium TaxID=33882 RepID=UPI00086F364A|nr:MULTISPECIES: pyridoxal-dependent decarboxylase, exosortase A system-associated [Microbacterium]MBD3756704.1 pyridoxal-dependent decarboxylase, exosortase A system-associated [Microbacterium sp.]MBN9224431.1 pyridoxal-dependent decarboxylase, exosortase A system-associated [Microbacterium sp.]ODT28399.1 MAG: pyridoxal-dependent decarboxylase, exosortase A system-associated [Microbacterium sp. SCN 70-27]